jgi:hypothetical protein
MRKLIASMVVALFAAFAIPATVLAQGAPEKTKKTAKKAPKKEEGAAGEEGAAPKKKVTKKTKKAADEGAAGEEGAAPKKKVTKKAKKPAKEAE